MKKIISILFVIAISVNSYSQNYWIKQVSPILKDFTKCSFTDSAHGWIAGDSGTIVHTSNAGATWVVQNSGITDYSIEDIFFLNNTTGWAISNDFIGTGSFFLKTTDGGNTWTNTRLPDSSVNFRTLLFLNSLTGFMGGTNGTIVKTTNGGLNWVKSRLENVYILSNLPILSITFLNSNTGLACGGQIDIAGTIWRTTDSGLNWNISDTTNEPMVQVRYYNDTLAFGGGGDLDFFGSIFSYTTNGGNTWKDSTWGYFGVGQAVAIRNLSDIWVPLGFSATWMRSVDSGRTFVQLSIDSSSIYDAEFIGDNGWAVGSKGAIYKYNKSLIGIENNGFEIPSAYLLSQNYPNPFNPSTTIQYSIPVSSSVKLTLYDVLGREVKILLDEFRQAGNHEINFSADELSTGVYFYKINAGDFTDSKKLVILK